jgi:dihydrofolate reductase
MRKVIATMNMTLDGFCDHTVMNADDELHNHYTDMLNTCGTLIYGRTTYQLMESFWPGLLKTPSGDKSMDDFALAIDKVPKVVFSTTLKDVEWKSARVAKRDLKEEIMDLKQQSGKDIAVGSPSLIVGTTNLGLVDEFHLCIHPTIVGKGLQLFKSIADKVDLTLIRSKPFASGAVVHYYSVIRK